MTETPTIRGAAESLLKQLQTALGGAAGDAPSRAALRAVERAHGAAATRAGRLLSELVAGSHAWDLWEGPPGHQAQAHGARLPRLHELCVCEPVLQLMRESGEMVEREHLLRERDAALAEIWARREATDERRWLDSETVQDEYFAAVQQVTASYLAHYEALREVASGFPAPLAAPRVRSRLLLQPPLMALLFSACHQESGLKSREAAECRRGGNALAWAGSDPLLDAMTWDVAALAVSAFYVRTGGSDFEAAFPVLVEDYFAWRGTDPRKRSRALREQVASRLEFLCSDRMQTHTEADLWLTDPDTGRRRKTAVVAEGPLLVKRSRFFRPSVGPGESEPETTGYLLSLGEWARPLVAERAMLGVSLKRLAEYDLQRQGWERRIGWYLAFQMNNQASKMTFQDVTKDGKTRTLVTPQHPLKMRTVLSGSHVAWEETARTNPGKVIKQWSDALDTLRRDGVLGPSPCLDGAADGSDLPARGRLAAMLERRFQFVPGRDLLPHLRAKRGAAERRRTA